MIAMAFIVSAQAEVQRPAFLILMQLDDIWSQSAEQPNVMQVLHSKTQ